MCDIKRNRLDPNEFIIHGKYAEMLLYDNYGNIVAKTKIDIDDIDKVKEIKWSLDNHKYVSAKCRDIKLYLHRILLEQPENHYVDHINRDRLDNRKSNLRIVRPTQNGMNKGRQSNNTSGYVGVSCDKSRNKWEAYIKIFKKKKHLGRYDDIKDAIMARKNAEQLYFGEYMCLNPNENTVFEKYN